jgi:hypothetical protein
MRCGGDGVADHEVGGGAHAVMPTEASPMPLLEKVWMGRWLPLLSKSDSESRRGASVAQTMR